VHPKPTAQSRILWRGPNPPAVPTPNRIVDTAETSVTADEVLHPCREGKPPLFSRRRPRYFQNLERTTPRSGSKERLSIAGEGRRARWRIAQARRRVSSKPFSQPGQPRA